MGLFVACQIVADVVVSRYMDIERFEFLARKLRSKEPAISAARMVLVHAVSAADAVRQTGISQPSL